jgi:SHS2 domain-containing protein
MNDKKKPAGPVYTVVERLEHTADLAIAVRGRTVADVFSAAAAEMFDMMTIPPEHITIRRRIDVESTDSAGLLVDWLNELIYLHETAGETYTEFVIEEITEDTLIATVGGGETIQKKRTIKAATYHQLRLEKDDDCVTAHIVFDV